MTDFEKISHLIRFGLSFHKINLQTIIEWAERKIDNGTDENLFFELSIVNSTNRTIELLSEKVIWNFNKKEIRILILSYYNEFLKNNPNKWLEIEIELSEYFQLFNYDDSNNQLDDFLYYLSDDLSLRKSNFNEQLIMPKYLIENLSEYNEYNELRVLLDDQSLRGYEIKKTISNPV